MKERLNLLLMAAVLMLPGLAGAQSNPCNPCGGKAANPCNPCGGKAANPCGMKADMPALNPCHAKKGTVFHVNDPMNRDSVSFTSEAPLEDFVGTTNQIHGYVAFDPSKPEKGAAGKFVIPVASLDTGIPLRNEHLQSETWLHASEHPKITFEFGQARNLRAMKKSAGLTVYEGSVVGDLTINGVTRNIRVPIRASYMKESQQTKKRLPGNLLIGRAEFEVPLSDYNIQGAEGVVGARVSESIEVEIRFAGTDQKPQGAANPCNPCGGKAANPCNPCGGKAANPCNPCGGKAANPCNPCGK